MQNSKYFEIEILFFLQIKNSFIRHLGLLILTKKILFFLLEVTFKLLGVELRSKNQRRCSSADVDFFFFLLLKV